MSTILSDRLRGACEELDPLSEGKTGGEYAFFGLVIQMNWRAMNFVDW